MKGLKFICLSFLFSCLALEASLIGYYTFEGNANDVSGNDKHGTVYGATLTTGYQGQAYSFDGTNDLISVNININPSNYSKLTMGAWAKVSDGSPIRQIISHDDGGYDRTLGIDYRGGGTGWSAFTGSSVLGYKPAANNWTFVAVVYDQVAATVDLYVDGSAYYATGKTAGEGFTFLTIGANPYSTIGTGHEFFSGILDNVFLYDEAMNASQIEYIRTNGISPVPEPCSIILLLFGTFSFCIFAKRES